MNSTSFSFAAVSSGSMFLCYHCDKTFTKTSYFLYHIKYEANYTPAMYSLTFLNNKSTTTSTQSVCYRDTLSNSHDNSSTCNNNLDNLDIWNPAHDDWHPLPNSNYIDERGEERQFSRLMAAFYATEYVDKSDQERYYSCLMAIPYTPKPERNLFDKVLDECRLCIANHLITYMSVMFCWYCSLVSVFEQLTFFSGEVGSVTEEARDIVCL